MTKELEFMREAVQEAALGIRSKHGGPFGCVIVRGGEIVGRGHNMVIASNDPTAHAEVVAIRDACKTLGRIELEDCTLYTSCEPCPMCMSAIYWARIGKVFFALTRRDAASVGFDDSMIYNELNLPMEDRKVKMQSLGRADAMEVFEEWKASRLI